MSGDNLETIAEQFVRARLAGQSFPQYPGTVPATLAEAYAVQELAIKRFPDAIVGWKVARIGAQWSKQYPEERLVGPVFQRNLHVARAGDVVDFPVFQGGFAAVEAEIVLRVNEDAPANKTNWTIDEAAELVRSFHLGVETAGSPLATLNELGPGAIIGDFGNNWGVIVGLDGRRVALHPGNRCTDVHRRCALRPRHGVHSSGRARRAGVRVEQVRGTWASAACRRCRFDGRDHRRARHQGRSAVATSCSKVAARSSAAPFFRSADTSA